jgi:very-short-patch-repair endonuclease
MPVMDAMTSISARAASQHGLISLAQLAELGVTRKVWRRFVAQGWLELEAPRVMAVAGAPASWPRRLHAGVLSLGGRSMVSHGAAAALHGFDRSTKVVEFTMDRSGRGRAGAFVVHTSAHLGRLDRVVADGLPVTSATRTIIDLARARVSTPVLEASIDSAVRLGLSSPIVIADRLSEIRGRGRWGCRRVDALLVDSGGHSRLERAFLALMRTSLLPRPRTQVVHRLGARTVARADFAFDPYPLVVEVNGRRGHVSDAERSKDAHRRNEMQALGREVLEFTWSDVVEDGQRVARQVRDCLQRLGWTP